MNEEAQPEREPEPASRLPNQGSEGPIPTRPAVASAAYVGDVPGRRRPLGKSALVLGIALALVVAGAGALALYGPAAQEAGTVVLPPASPEPSTPEEIELDKVEALEFTLAALPDGGESALERFQRSWDEPYPSYLPPLSRCDVAGQRELKPFVERKVPFDTGDTWISGGDYRYRMVLEALAMTYESSAAEVFADLGSVWDEECAEFEFEFVNDSDEALLHDFVYESEIEPPEGLSADWHGGCWRGTTADGAGVVGWCAAIFVNGDYTLSALSLNTAIGDADGTGELLRSLAAEMLES